MDPRGLVRRLSLPEAEAEGLIRDGQFGERLHPFWLNGEMRYATVGEPQPADEFWEYDSPQERWDLGMGVSGFALVRDGQVIAFDQRLMN